MAKIRKRLREHGNDDTDTWMEVEVAVDINADGMFTTTISKEDAAMIESYGVRLENNRAGRPGFFINETMAGLLGDIRKVMLQCLNYRVVSETPVLKYYINTFCNYCLDNRTGDIAPNGKRKFVGDDNYQWHEGTRPAGIGGTDFGIMVYVEPFMKRVVEYGNGKQSTFYDHWGHWEDGSYMEWLDELPRMKPQFGSNVQEMEGTEENARFFVNIIKQICRINEQIGDILKEGRLEDLIQSTLKLEKII